MKRTGTDRWHLNDFWLMLAEKYHFHAGHALIHNETGEIADLSCHLNQWKQRKGIYHSKYLALGINISKNNNNI
jgi:hypothetical protein